MRHLEAHVVEHREANEAAARMPLLREVGEAARQTVPGVGRPGVTSRQSRGGGDQPPTPRADRHPSPHPPPRTPRMAAQTTPAAAVRAVPSRGMGVVAARPIRAGEIIFDPEPPLLTVVAKACETWTCAWCLHACKEHTRTGRNEASQASQFCSERCQQAAEACPAFVLFDSARHLASEAALRYVNGRAKAREARAKKTAGSATPADAKGKRPLVQEDDDDDDDDDEEEEDEVESAEDDLRMLLAVAAQRCAAREGHEQSKRASIEFERLCSPEDVAEALQARSRQLLDALRETESDSSRKRQRSDHERDDKVSVVVRNIVGAIGAHLSAANTLARVHCNSFGVMAHADICDPLVDDVDDERRLMVRGTVMYARLSRFNHSCAPNVCRFDRFDEDANWAASSAVSLRSAGDMWNGRADSYVLAMTDIPAGEELCISYLPLIWIRRDRRERLEGYGFRGICPRCQVEVDEDDEEDDEEEGEEEQQQKKIVDDVQDEEEGNATLRTYYELWINRHTCSGCCGTLAPIAINSCDERCSRCGRVECDAELSFRKRLEASNS